MGEAQMEPQPDFEGEEMILALIIEKLADVSLESSAYELLAQRARDAFRQFETSEDTRLLELEENSRRLGEKIREILDETAVNNAIVTVDMVNIAFVRLCPGFWPFC